MTSKSWLLPSWQDPHVPFPHEDWSGCPRCESTSVVSLDGRPCKCMQCGLEFHPHVYGPAPLASKVIDLGKPFVTRVDGLFPPCAKCSRVLFIPTDDIIIPWRGTGIITLRCVYCLTPIQAKLS